jgi:(1->4)-alpha-D-glucan 1-alpha-D-glucosylmutase
MRKAAREAKRRTSWINVDTAYEEALDGFVRSMLDDDSEFLADLAAQAHRFAWFGGLTSISMALIKLTAPGVPDCYQGNESVELSLVDPDNRRPVDFARRRAMLEELQTFARMPASERAGSVQKLIETPDDGRAKLWVIAQALALRRDDPELFAHGEYRALRTAGSKARHVVAYVRSLRGRGVVVVTGRLYASLGPPAGTPPLGALAWGDTRVTQDPVCAGAPLVDALTGAARDAAMPLPIAEAFAHFPGAILRYGTPSRD